MAYLADSIWVNSTTSGLADFTLGTALPAYRTFATAAVPNGSIIHYSARTTTEFENGEGIFTSPSTLSRVTIFASSNANAKVNFGANPTIAVSPLAEDIDAKADKITTVIAGAGLTGGGDLSTNRTLDVGGSTSIIVGANDVQRAALTGDVTAPQNDNATTIANSAVTNAKLANMATNTIKGVQSSGPPTDLNAAAVRNVAGLEYGKDSIWVPADLFRAISTAPPSPGTYTDATGFIWPTWDFDQTAQEFVNVAIGMPKGWDLTNVTYIAYWTAAAGSGGVMWIINATAVGDDDPLGGAYVTGSAVTDTLLAANDLHITSESGALGLNLAPATTHDILKLQLMRDPTNGADTLNADARLIGIKFMYNFNAGNDN